MVRIISIIIILIIGASPINSFTDANAESFKVAYLTFDDGPSLNTVKILDCLDNYGIKGSFFVIKRDGYDNIYKKIIEESHTLGGHSYSHDYSKIYTSADSYYEDLRMLSDYVQQITGRRFNVIRFPGGSNNQISNKYNKNNIMKTITTQANYYGYDYFDWNVDAEDAKGELKDCLTIAQNVINQCKNKNRVIILMHDGPFAKTTPDSLPIIIDYLQSQGYEFKAITQDTPVMKF